jgi:Spy/CpxP family protein refolding chaperone
MHPAMISWWKARHGYDCGGEERAGCGPGGGWGGRGWGGRGQHGHGHGHGDGWEASGGGGDADGGGGFGVRRPLRFLAYKLELDEGQVEKLARVLDELKIERAQAAVDHRRTSAAFADAVAGDTLDAAALAAAASDRAKSAERLGSAVTKALSKMHELLTPKQRGQLAYLIRTGTLGI